MKIQALLSFYVKTERIEPGVLVEVPPALAAELIHANKAQYAGEDEKPAGKSQRKRGPLTTADAAPLVAGSVEPIPDDAPAA